MPKGIYPRTPIEERFWSKVNSKNNCWLWLGAQNGNGYGCFWFHGTLKKAHRVSYEWAKGNIPIGLELDHLCRVHLCVNPAHLEAVTRKENLRRGIGHGSESHCPQKHPYDSVNTYLKPNGRECRICNKVRKRKVRFPLK